MLTMLTKRSVLITSLLALAFIGLFSNSWKVGLCQADDIPCIYSYDHFSSSLFIFIPILIFSLVIYKMSDRVFELWAPFTVLWTPVSIFSILAAGTEVGQNPGAVSGAGIMLLGTLAIYCIGSITIILWRWH